MYRPAADHVIGFIEKFLVHSKGEWAGNPFILEPWQCFLISSIFGWKKIADGNRRFRIAYVEIPRKNGKMLDLNTPIPTPTGFKLLNEIKIGDEIYSGEGDICKVIALSEIDNNPESYEITFSNNEKIRACADHQWTIKTKDDRKSFTKNGKLGGCGRMKYWRGDKIIYGNNSRIVTTRQLKNILFTGKHKKELNCSIDRPRPIDSPTKELPIHPYLLGLWLGDGTSACAHITGNESDLSYYISYLKGKTNYDYTIRDKSNYVHERAATLVVKKGFQIDLRKNNLLNNKHIPDVYFSAAKSQRLELLAGLLDSDGCIGGKYNQVEFCNKNLSLAHGVWRLACSFSWKARIIKSRATLYGKDCGEKNRVFFNPDFENNPFLLPRKRNKLLPIKRRDNFYKVKSVKEIQPIPMRCISVDSPNHTYLCGHGYIPTHNTTLAAAIGLYLLVGDKEPGAEVFTAATKRDQARIAHTEATNMVKSSKDLKEMIAIFKDNLSVSSTMSKYMPLGADADTMDGLNASGIIIDELHAHKTRDMWDVLDTATGARRQPLIFAITTAGSNQEGICYEQHEYAKKILKGAIKDESFFCFIAAMDVKEHDGDTEDDDWTKERTWRKANPSYGISVKINDLKEKALKAIQSPASQNGFLNKHLNRWTQQADRWISLEMWDANNTSSINEDSLVGRRCYGGLDLSSVSDISAWVMVFPDEEDPEKIDIVARLWCPEDALWKDGNKYKAQYQLWAKQGFLTTTPGNCIDFSFIKHKIISDAEKFGLVDMNIDALFQAHQLGTELVNEGVKVFGMRLGFISFAAPMKDFERKLLARKLNHGGNPVLRWMADNVTVVRDAVDNLKPDKASSQGKIDGIVALVMALDRLSRNSSGGTSIYETRGILSLDEADLQKEELLSIS